MTAYIEPTGEDISIARNNRKTARTAIFCKDAQGRFLSCNPVYQQFIGLSMDEIIGHTVEEIGAVSHEYPPLIDDADILAGQTFSNVLGQLLDGTNNPRHVMVSKSPLIIKGKIAGIVGTIEDITEQVAQSKTLLQLTEAIQYVPGGILVYEWKGTEDYKLLLISPLAKEMFNIPEETSDGINDILQHCLHPDDSWCVSYLAKRLMAGADIASCKCRFYPIGSQEFIWINIRVRSVPKDSGKVLLYISLADITAEQRNAQALAESQRAYKVVADGAGLIVWHYDMVNNTMEFLNDVNTMKRYMPDNVPRKLYGGPEEFLQFIQPECWQDLRQLHQNLRQGKSGRCDIQYISEPEQPPRWARLIYTLPVGVTDPTDAYGVGINITAEKLREEQYNNEVQMLHSAVKTNILAKAHFDLTEDKLVDYIRHSPNALNLRVGCEYEFFYEQLLGMILAQEEQLMVAEKLNKGNLMHICAQNNSTFSMEYKRHCEDLSPIMVECTVSLFTNKNGHAECFICFYDITNKFINYTIADKLNELGYSRAALVNNLTGTMTYYSKNTGVLENTPEHPLFYDQKLLEYICQTIPDKEKAQTLYQKLNLDAITAYLDDHEQEKMFDFSFDLWEGPENKYARYRMQACYLDSSRTSVFIIQSDITKQYQKEREQLQKLEEALSIADKANTSKSMFLAGISHDMRTPLNGILSFTDFALKTESQSQQKYYLNKIRQSGELLLSLINDTLNLTRIESGKVTVNPEWVDSKAMLDTVIAGVYMSAQERQLSLNIHREANVPAYIIMDKLKMQEILLNILSNAVKFTKPGGSVNLDISLIPPQQQTPQELAAVQSVHHKWIRLIIWDTGIGMSQEFLPHLFEAFAQEESTEVANPNGTGLGLAIAKKYMDMMGGSIHVRSKLNHGTTFELHLMVEETEEKASSHSSGGNHCHFGNLHILLAEDNALNQEIAQMLLTTKGARLDIVSNGQEAVDKFEASKPGTYQLILMDIRMPVMNGYNAAEKIRHSQHPDGADIPIIAMTADAYEDDIKHCMAVGMNGHISKPINPDKLYNEIAKCCNSI